MKWLRPASPHQLRGKLIPLPQSSKHTFLVNRFSSQIIQRKIFWIIFYFIFLHGKGSGQTPLRWCVLCVLPFHHRMCFKYGQIENRRTLSPGSARHLSCYMTPSFHPLTLEVLFRNSWISNRTIEIVSA